MCTIAEGETLISPISPARFVLASKVGEVSSTSAKRTALSNLVLFRVGHPANAVVTQYGNAILFQESVFRINVSSFSRR